mmetsp:Transcript_24865/g.58731  ORF Transcript_24865/g.58731 Transcript_24865/m.58731 type:complete len:210 (+) Transcript_24865:381-1010(+)
MGDPCQCAAQQTSLDQQQTRRQMTQLQCPHHRHGATPPPLLSAHAQDACDIGVHEHVALDTHDGRTADESEEVDAAFEVGEERVELLFCVDVSDDGFLDSAWERLLRHTNAQRRECSRLVSLTGESVVSRVRHNLGLSRQQRSAHKTFEAGEVEVGGDSAALRHALDACRARQRHEISLPTIVHNARPDELRGRGPTHHGRCRLILPAH